MNESIKSTDFSEEQWQEVDQKLFAGMPLLALRAVLEFGKPSLRLLDAQEIMFERYANLRAECPAQFVEEASTYWADWDTD